MVNPFLHYLQWVKRQYNKISTTVLVKKRVLMRQDDQQINHHICLKLLLNMTFLTLNYYLVITPSKHSRFKNLPFSNILISHSFFIATLIQNSSFQGDKYSIKNGQDHPNFSTPSRTFTETRKTFDTDISRAMWANFQLVSV